MWYIIAFLLLSTPLVTINTKAIKLDTSFGTQGKAIINFGQDSGHFNKVIPFRFKALPDGKILLTGDIYNNDDSKLQSKVFIARYNADGCLDTSFGKSGIVIIDIGNLCTSSFDIALQSNGNILVAGRSTNVEDAFAEYPADFGYIACLAKDGIIDKSFGNNGIIQLPTEKTQEGYLCSTFHQLEIDKDDSIVVVGSQGIMKKKDGNNHYPSSDYKAILVKYTKNGVLDQYFGSNCVVRTTFYSSPSEESDGFGIAMQKDGKIIIVGDSDNSAGNINLTEINGTQKAGLARFYSSGILDKTFGKEKTGYVTIPLQTKGAMLFNVVIDKNEKIIVIGFAHNNTTDKTEFLIARYKPDGELDPLFGNGGIKLISIGTSNAYAYGVGLQNNGKIIVTGIAQWGNYKKFTIVRCTEEGQLDITFGPDKNGIYVESLSDYDDRSIALTLLDNQKILIAGDSFNGKYFDSVLSRFILE